jgi:hypothetical protein
MFTRKLYVSKSLKSSSHVLVGTLGEDCPGEDARQSRTAREKSESRAGNRKSITTTIYFHPGQSQPDARSPCEDGYDSAKCF